MIKIKGHKFYTLEEILKKDLKSKSFRDGYYKELNRLRIVAKMKRVRLAKKMTQEKLAQKAGMPQSVIARLESGRQGLSFATISQIATALGKRIELI